MMMSQQSQLNSPLSSRGVSRHQYTYTHCTFTFFRCWSHEVQLTDIQLNTDIQQNSTANADSANSVNAHSVNSVIVDPAALLLLWVLPKTF